LSATVPIDPEAVANVITGAFTVTVKFLVSEYP
jgi:hypothetical protein